MSKVRVYEVAKQINMSNKDLVEILNKLGIEVKNHMGSLTKEEVELVLKRIGTSKPTPGQAVNPPIAKKNVPNRTENKKVETTRRVEPAKKSDMNKKVEPAKKVEPSKKVEPAKKVESAKKVEPAKKVEINKSGNGKPKSNNNRPKSRKRGRERGLDNTAMQENSKEEISFVKLPSTINIKNLSLKIDKQASDIIKMLMKKGIMSTANQEIDFELAQTVCEEFEILAERMEEIDVIEEFFREEPDKEEDLSVRPPIVVVMGHVDHGKTSLLDAIRKSKVTEGEQRGITQHIGASIVQINDQKITFLDTPGHEAFTAMRLRGAMATDIAILVVAADDGVMPQTIEAINHAKAANVRIIVAVNKIDKPGANPDRVKQELVEYGLVAEEWGGDTICVEVSALEHLNIDQLLEMILLVSEMEELKANPNKSARGTVIEAELDKGRGPVATVLVQSGTLKIGDSIVAGTAHGRIRAMLDDKGRRVKQALPSTPVEILGLSEAPLAGEAFYVAKNEKEARHVAEKANEKNREKLMTNTPHKVTLDDLFTQIQAGDMKELKIIVKADVQGSVEAVRQSLVKLSNEEVMITVLHGGVGAINESDVMLASASNAIIIGFNVRPEAAAKITAKKEEIDIRLYRVIYNAIEDIEAAMIGMLDPEYREKVIGHAEVRKTFKVSGIGTIAGAYVIDGKIFRKSRVRLLRDNVVIYEGELDSLKRFKDDAKEVLSGYECGFTLEKYNDIKESDVLEAFIMEEIPR